MKLKNMKQEQPAGNMAQRRQILSKNSGFAVREAYKTLRTNLHFTLRSNSCKKFCITSGKAGEGKSITLLNLAISFAESGQKVLLIDADLRRPAVARLLVEKATPGLSNVLAELADVDEAVRREVYPNLDILFSGDIPPNPSELLGSDSFEKLIDKLSARYDYILVDTPPVNVVTDACIVAKLLDGVLILTRQEKSTRESVKQAVDSLQLVGAKILGFVLNGVAVDTRKDYSYYD